jgi:hypothetical protein
LIWVKKLRPDGSRLPALQMPAVEDEMFRFNRLVRASLAALAAMVVLGASSGPSQAQATTGTVLVEVTKAGLVFGVGGGKGVLIYQGRRYPLSIGGLSFGATIGVSKTQLVGRASNLRQASDIAGTYISAGGGVAVAGGVASVRLQNAKGVVLDLRGRKGGFEFSANLSGVEVALQ